MSKPSPPGLRPSVSADSTPLAATHARHTSTDSEFAGSRMLRPPPVGSGRSLLGTRSNDGSVDFHGGEKGRRWRGDVDGRRERGDDGEGRGGGEDDSLNEVAQLLGQDCNYLESMLILRHSLSSAYSISSSAILHRHTPLVLRPVAALDTLWEQVQERTLRDGIESPLLNYAIRLLTQRLKSPGRTLMDEREEEKEMKKRKGRKGEDDRGRRARRRARRLRRRQRRERTAIDDIDVSQLLGQFTFVCIIGDIHLAFCRIFRCGIYIYIYIYIIIYMFYVCNNYKRKFVIRTFVYLPCTSPSSRSTPHLSPSHCYPYYSVTIYTLPSNKFLNLNLLSRFYLLSRSPLYYYTYYS